MLLDWHCPHANGFWPRLSWPWVAYGNRGIWLSNLETGETHDLGVDGYPHGWIGPTIVRCSALDPANNDVRALFDLSVPEFARLDVATVDGVMELRASLGHWATWDTANRVGYDGRVIAEGYHGIRQAGEWVAARSIAEDYALLVFRGGELQGLIPKQCEVYDWAVGADGTVVYGYPKVLVSRARGGQQDVSRSPWAEGSTGGGGGFRLIDVDGVTWLWSCAQLDVGGRWGVIGGPLGDPAVVVVDVEAGWLDAQIVGDHFIIAASSATGALRVVAVPVDAPRVRLEKPAAPPASAAFALDRTEGPVPLTVRASLTSANLTTWRWTLDGVIHQPIEGQTHGFEILAPGTHAIGVRTMPALDVPAQTVTALPAPVVVTPPVTAKERFWGLQTFELLPDPWAGEIARRGWGRVRVQGTDYGRIMAQCQKYEIWPLWILRRGEESTVPGGISCEIGNECNAGCEGTPPWPALSAADYAAWVLEAWPVLLAKGCTAYAGAANNTSPAGIAWTRDVLARLPFHPQLRVSFHRYPDPDQDVSKPKKGHKSIAAEDAAILDCVKGRRWGILEAGLLDVIYRDWSSWRYFGKKRTRLALAGHLDQAARFKRLGADAYVVYQVQGEFGVRNADGTWKLTADLPRLAG